MKAETATEILIVDDDPVSTFITSYTLRREFPGLVMNLFNSGSLGLNFLSDQSISSGSKSYAIFLDINMPVMSGWEFLNILEENYQHLPIQVLMLTSSVDPKDKSRAFQYPRVRDFISKPIQRDDLHAIKAVLAPDPYFLNPMLHKRTGIIPA